MKIYKVTRPPVINAPARLNYSDWLAIGHSPLRFDFGNGWYCTLYWNKTACVKVVHPAMGNGDAVFPISAAGPNAVKIAVSFGLLISGSENLIDPSEWDFGPIKCRDRSQRYRDI